MRDETVLGIVGIGACLIGAWIIFGDHSSKKKNEEFEAELKLAREQYLNRLEGLKEDIAANVDVTVSNDIVRLSSLYAARALSNINSL